LNERLIQVRATDPWRIEDRTAMRNPTIELSFKYDKQWLN
jgi:hypothetical protein